MAVRRIDQLMTQIGVKGGMSLTSGFDVEFNFAGKDLDAVKQFYQGQDKEVVTMLCDEAQLPNVQSAVAQITGRHLGEGPISYPHTRIFTDLSLGFLLDAKMIPLKFFTAWYNTIFNEAPSFRHDGTIDGALSADLPGKSNRINRVHYMDDYTCTAKIVKTEPNENAANGRAPITYYLENCYPYSIDAVPLSYGTSQVTRATVNFYYTRHQVAYGN